MNCYITSATYINFLPIIIKKKKPFCSSAAGERTGNDHYCRSRLQETFKIIKSEVESLLPDANSLKYYLEQGYASIFFLIPDNGRYDQHQKLKLLLLLITT